MTSLVDSASQVSSSASDTAFDWDQLAAASVESSAEEPESTSQLPSDVKLCPTCNEPIVRIPGTRGRLPKYHPDCKPKTSSRSSTTVVRVSKAAQLAAEETETALANLDGLLRKAVFMTAMVDPYDAMVIHINRGELIDNLRPILMRFEWARKQFLNVQTGGSILGLVFTLASIALPIMAHHKLIPSQRLSVIFLNLPTFLMKMQDAEKNIDGADDDITQTLLSRVMDAQKRAREAAQRKAAEAMMANGKPSP